MHRKNAIDFHCTVAMAVAYRVGTITMTVSNVMDKAASLNCQNKDGVQIWKGKSSWYCFEYHNFLKKWRLKENAR